MNNNINNGEKKEEEDEEEEKRRAREDEGETECATRKEAVESWYMMAKYGVAFLRLFLFRRACRYVYVYSEREPTG